ncbi:copia-type polyprotein, partial [Trifolium pratense]
METIFVSQDLWDVVEEEYEERPSPKNASWSDDKEKAYKENVKKNATALRFIQQGVSKAIYPRIFGVKKAKDAWEILKTEFQGSSKVISIKLQSLWSQFENLAMKEGEQVKDFFSRVTEIGNQIKSCGDEVPEKKVVEKILRSLPQKFEHVVAVIEETKDLTKLSQYELMGSLEAHEQRVNRYNNQPLENVFQAKMNIRSSNPQQGRWDSFRGQPSNRGHGRHSGNRGRGRGRGERRQGNQNIFEELNKNYSSHVELGDGNHVKIEGKGVVAVHTSEGEHIVTVLQTPNNLFPLNMKSFQPAAFSSKSPDDSYLWHLRYGHLNIKGLQLLKQKNMVVGLPEIKIDNEVCEGCIYGKMHHLPFPKTAWRSQAPLELVHADICGPTRTPSLGNKRYFLLFVDDYTRMIWIYFLDQKSEAFVKFLHFKALVENQSGHKLKTLRTDRGGEFIYKPFLNYCEEQGIHRQLTIRHTPQQNGVAERKNRTIVEMARSMLKGKGLPNNFWAEAVSSAVYILNRSPTKAVRDRTPFEAWHGRKPV